MKNVKGLPYIDPPKLPPWPFPGLFQPSMIILSSLDHKKTNDFNLVNVIDRDFRFFGRVFNGIDGGLCLWT